MTQEELDLLKVQMNQLLNYRNQSDNFQENFINYICRICQESRKIDIFFNFSFRQNPKSPVKEDMEDEDYFLNCIYLVKFIGASYLQSIWVSYNVALAFGKTKLMNFIKRKRD